MLKFRLLPAIALVLPLALGARDFDENKSYVISSYTNTAHYMTETGSLTRGEKGRNALWRFVPTENEDCYYIQSVATGKFIQSSTGVDKPVGTAFDEVEFHVVNDPAKGENCYGLASTDQADITFTSATIGLNNNDNGYVAGFNAALGGNPKSFWYIEECDEDYLDPFTTPYVGAQPEENQSYYLYQVETGRWLQANMTDANKWTTHAELGEYGFDVELRKLEGFNEGFQIFCWFTNNGELNGSDQDRCYLDQGDRAKCEWIFEPVIGVSNGFRIFIKAKDGEGVRDRDRIKKGIYLGAIDGGRFGGLAPSQDQEVMAKYTTWQLVTREERIQKLLDESKSTAQPVDCSWLIPWHDRGRNDNRSDRWSIDNRHNGENRINFEGLDGYPVEVYWNEMKCNESITLSGLPAGTYRFSVQGFYRDAEIGSEGQADRFSNGTDRTDRCWYFAGTERNNFKSIYADAYDEDKGGGYFHIADKWVPDASDKAGLAFLEGRYMNPYLTVPVIDGTLTIGVGTLDERINRDYFVYKRFYLYYDGEDTSGAIQEQLKSLQQLYNECLNLKTGEFADIYSFDDLSLTQFDNALSAANRVLQAQNPEADAINAAANALSNAYAVVTSASDDIIAFYQTYMLILKEQDVDQAKENNLVLRDEIENTDFLDTFNEAETRNDFANALREIKYARRMRNAVQHYDNFKHQPVGEGKFYLYNVGRKMFLSGGSDWGAHAALGNPGVEVTLEADGSNFFIETGLYNEDKHYLGESGYMDSPKFAYTFVPVPDMPNVYNIASSENSDLLVQWNPYARVDAGNGNELTVGTQDVGDPSNPDAQWVLVTREDRLSLAERATEENPVDLTFLISRPGFNQRERFSTFWFNEGFAIWGENQNHSDFALESYNGGVGVNFSHQLEDIPLGVYKVCIQGFYRNGDHYRQANADKVSNAVLFAGKNSTPLVNITLHDNQAPTDGTNAVASDGTTYHYPYDIPESTVWFRTGLFNNYVVATVEDGYTLPIGVEKTAKGEDGDWIVVDNIRLYYYGPDADEDVVAAADDPAAYIASDASGVEDVIEDSFEPVGAPVDNVIYNLQGIRVANPSTPGIYIVNGKKVLIK